MNRLRLDKLIVANQKAHDAVQKADTALNDFCIGEWGFTPSDRDVDEILDSAFGLCGASSPLSSDEFIRLMEAAR